MKKMLLFLVILITNCNSSNSPINDELIGIWQRSPVMNAGWNDSFAFYGNGTFTFRFNTALCDKREKGFTGHYTLSDSTVIMVQTSKMMLEGGKLVEAKGGCVSDMEITGGSIKHVTVNPPDTVEYTMTPIHMDGDFNKLTLKIGGADYWKHREDPDAY